MEGISDIRIVAIDAKRPPAIRKQPYIDLFFELSHEVPKLWGDDFNESLAKHKFPAKVHFPEGLFIETWVRTPDEIAELLEVLKTKVEACNEAYIARIMRSRGEKSDANKSIGEVGGEQGRLNGIIAGLKFDA